MFFIANFYKKSANFSKCIISLNYYSQYDLLLRCYSIVDNTTKFSLKCSLDIFIKINKDLRFSSLWNFLFKKK